MNRTLSLTLTTAAACLALSSCSSSATTAGSDTASSSPSASSPTVAAAPTEAAATLTASQAMAAVAKAVPQAHETLVLTDTTDPNNLMGRPNEYTSDVRFSDSRVPASDTSPMGLSKGDVQFGGSIEVFPTAADAAARAKYIQSVTVALPEAAEYDFVSGPYLIRVSHFLTPAQAAVYQAAVDALG
jgi:hypothetical protein